MKELAVAFLWHLHQPYYTDPLTKTAPLPWVRLHAIKGYFDMGILLDAHPDVRVTVNLTPSLLLQLQELADGSVTDLFWTHTARQAADLTGDESVFILRYFFSANWDTMIRPHDRYYGLLIQRGTHPRDEDLPELARRFTTQDLLDIQVWHNLAWFGHRALAQYPVLRELTAKGRQFTESDKQIVLATQREIVGQIIPLFRRLQDRGQVELSTTPFFHPILPLLIDTDSARRSRPNSALPQRFAHQEDAVAQLRKALSFHEGLFGRRPVGLWPSEGSVCPELVPILTKLGFRWAATDEGILARSLDHWRPSGRDRQSTRLQSSHTVTPYSVLSARATPCTAPDTLPLPEALPISAPQGAQLSRGALRPAPGRALALRRLGVPRTGPDPHEAGLPLGRQWSRERARIPSSVAAQRK